METTKHHWDEAEALAKFGLADHGIGASASLECRACGLAFGEHYGTQCPPESKPAFEPCARCGSPTIRYCMCETCGLRTLHDRVSTVYVCDWCGGIPLRTETGIQKCGSFW